MASPEDPKRSKLPRGNALLGVLLIASALIAGLYVHEGSAGPVHAVRGGIAAVLSPATLLGGAVSGGESAASDALENAAADDASYSELKDENARLRAAVIEMEEYRQEADRLQGLLDHIEVKKDGQIVVVFKGGIESGVDGCRGLFYLRK